jgi:flagellar hook-length control protein FliK
MSTRVETARPSANKANDLLKNLAPKPAESSQNAQPFKKELAKAQRTSDKPKSEAKAEEPHAKKPQKAEKKSDVKAKKPAKPREGQSDEQPVDEVETTETAKKPETADQSDDATTTDDVDAEKPADQPKVKTEAKADEQPAEALIAAANVQKPQAVENKDQAEGDAEAKDSAPQAPVKAIAAKGNQKAEATDPKAVAKAKKDGEQDADGAIDLSQLEDVTDADDADDADDDASAVPAKPQAAETDDDRRAQQAAAGATPKVTTAQQPALAIQPMQQQANQQGGTGHQQTNDGDENAQVIDPAQMFRDAAPADATSETTSRAKSVTASTDGEQFASLMTKTSDATNVAKPVQAAPPPPAPPEVQFASANHDKIITGLKSELLPNGGTMHIRLDPPELGALQVRVSMQDGVMTAAFETSNDDATKLLSHSLSQLKHALESQGVSVDKLHVQQSPRNESSSNQKDENGQPQGQAQNQRSAQQEQQRKEMIRRMWAKLGVIQDPLDMVA